jgi:hypothetical protein
MSVITLFHDRTRALAACDDRGTDGQTKERLPGRICKIAIAGSLLVGAVGRNDLCQRLRGGLEKMLRDHPMTITSAAGMLPKLLQRMWAERPAFHGEPEGDRLDTMITGFDASQDRIRNFVFQSLNGFQQIETTADANNRTVVLGAFDARSESEELLEFTRTVGRGEKETGWILKKQRQLIDGLSRMHSSIGRGSYFAGIDRSGQMTLPAEFPGPPIETASAKQVQHALAEAGRFYVGSITTPMAGQPDTVGNADGGAAAQMGITTVLNFSTATIHSVTGTGSITNPQQAIDSDPTTYAAIDFTADGTNGNYAELDLASLPGVAQQYSSANLVIDVAVPTNTVAPADSLYVMGWFELRSRDPYVYSPTTNLGNFFFVHPGYTQARQTVTLALPLGLNLSQLFLEFYTLVTSTQVSGSCEVRIHDARIVAVQ